MPFEIKWQKLFKLARKEQSYLLYLAMIGIGVYILVGQITEWASAAFGELDVSHSVRTSLLGATVIFTGFQALISHFLLSIVLMGSTENSQLAELE
jgi:hypothetical protein